MPDVPLWVVADRGYSSHAFREHIWNIGARPAVPAKRDEAPVVCSDWAYSSRRLAVAAPASATLTPTQGPGGENHGTDNVIFNACTGNVMTGLTVQGCLNTSRTTLVNFTGTETLVANGAKRASGPRSAPSTT